MKYFSLRDNGFGRWIIVNPNAPDHAWSGSRWVLYQWLAGSVARPVVAQLSNYETPQEAAAEGVLIPDDAEMEERVSKPS